MSLAASAEPPPLYFTQDELDASGQTPDEHEGALNGYFRALMATVVSDPTTQESAEARLQLTSFQADLIRQVYHPDCHVSLRRVYLATAGHLQAEMIPMARSLSEKNLGLEAVLGPSVREHTVRTVDAIKFAMDDRDLKPVAESSLKLIFKALETYLVEDPELARSNTISSRRGLILIAIDPVVFIGREVGLAAEAVSFLERLAIAAPDNAHPEVSRIALEKLVALAYEYDPKGTIRGVATIARLGCALQFAERQSENEKDTPASEE